MNHCQPICRPGLTTLGVTNPFAIILSLGHSRNGTRPAKSPHFSDRPNTTVACRVPVGPSPSDVDDIRVPDLLVAFDCELIKEHPAMRRS